MTGGKRTEWLGSAAQWWLQATSLTSTENRFIAMKASPSSVTLPSATTSRHPDSAAVAAAGGTVTGRIASHMAALGLPLVFMAVARSMAAIPPMVPPPWASLKASPLFHALKSFSCTRMEFME